MALHHRIKAALVKKYNILAGEELLTALQTDEKGLSEEEITEVLEEIRIYNANPPGENKPAPKPAKKTATVVEGDYKHKVYEEWRVEATGPKDNKTIEKLKKLRSNVKLHADAVEQLNEAGKTAAELGQGGHYIMYFEAE